MQPGDRIADRLEILESAGAGGMGVVYRARDLASGQVVALKVLLEKKAELTERFAQEVELLSTLEHPHIVSYVAHGRTDKGTPYLVMPWLEGEDLEKRLSRGPLSIEDVLVLARAVGSALAYLHERNIVHRDLKPSNLFLQGGRIDDVKLIDLGIARATVPTRPLTLSGMLLGTPAFMAPEQARGDGTLAPSVDLFALGCVLFECLTGERLFAGSHVMAVLAKILVDEAPRVRSLRPDVSDALDTLVARLVDKSPGQRPRDGAELLQWLEDDRLLSPASIRSSPPALTATERRVVSVAAVVLGEEEGKLQVLPDSTKVESGSLLSASGRFGVTVQPLDARTAIVLPRDGAGATDHAVVLARFAEHVAELYASARIAIATGSAVTAERFPVGIAIDRAVAMVRAASPGRGVELDELTASLVSTRFDVRDEGNALLLGEERLSDPTRPLLGRPTSCVGRERELGLLEATFGECVDGSGPKIVLVTAAPGAGKSRLRHELERRLRLSDKPPRMLYGWGNPLAAATPHAQISQVVRQAMGVGPREDASVALEKITAHAAEVFSQEEAPDAAAFLAELVGLPFPSDRLVVRAARQSPEAMADHLRRTFTGALRGWAKREPVVLVLEDVHYGDAATIKLVDHALARLDGAAILVLALARPEAHERFPELWNKRHLTEVRLPPLPRRAAMTLAREVVGDSVPEEEVSRIVEVSEGNAFYLEELLRAAAVPPSSRTGPRSSSPPPGTLPETIIAVAQARLERLEPPVRKLLRAASVFGESFTADGLAALLRAPVEELSSGIAVLVDNEIVRPTEHAASGFTFRHALLRAAAYASLTDEDRELGHRLAAEWLVSVGEDLELVAIHHLEGGERGRAADRFVEAGALRLSRGQPADAARCMLRSMLFMDAQKLGGTVTASRVATLAEALEGARTIVTDDLVRGLERHVRPPIELPIVDGARVLSLVLRSAIVAVRSESVETRVNVLRRSADALASVMAIAEAKELVAEAREAAKGDAVLERELLFTASRVSFLWWEYAAVAEALSGTVLPEGPKERVSALLQLGISLVAVGGSSALSRGLDCIERAERVVEALGDPPVARAHCFKARVMCLAFARDYDGAFHVAEVAAALARSAGLRYDEASQLHNMGDAGLRIGKSEKAKAALLASRDLMNDIGVEHLRTLTQVLLWFLDEDVASLERATEASRSRNQPFPELYVLQWLGRLYHKKGESSRARGALARALELARTLGVFVEQCEADMATYAAA